MWNVHSTQCIQYQDYVLHILFKLPTTSQKKKSIFFFFNIYIFNNLNMIELKVGTYA